MMMHAETFGQCVTVTRAFLAMPGTTEEELKKFYFTGAAFGARLLIEPGLPIFHDSNSKG